MPSGNTTTDALDNSMPTAIAAARPIREYGGRFPKLAMRETLKEGSGRTYNEVELDQLSAQAVSQTTDLEQNPQQFVDTLRSYTMQTVGISTFITDDVASYVDKKVLAKMGMHSMNAMIRRKDEDGITVGQGATTDIGASGAVMSGGEIAAAVARIRGNTTEPGEGPIYAVFHGFGIKDIWDEITAGVGTYAVPNGFTEATWRNGFSGSVAGAEVYDNGNIAIVSNNAEGFIFARESLLLAQGPALKREVERRAGKGGGGTLVYIYDRYAYGERSPGNWMFSMTHDASVPTG